MCHSVFFGVLLGFIASRMLWRMRARRFNGGWGGCGGFGGGCGRGFEGGWRHGQRPWGRFRGGMGFGGGFTGPFTAGDFAAHKPAAELIAGLELNQRQKDDADAVLALLQAQLGARGPRVSAALAAVASAPGAPFDRIAAEDALAPVPPAQQRELLDGLEHLHNILIPEQRDRLRDALSRPATGTAV